MENGLWLQAQKKAGLPAEDRTWRIYEDHSYFLMLKLLLHADKLCWYGKQLVLPFPPSTTSSSKTT